MTKAIIFDMDGVLINTEPLHYRVWKEAFHRRGLEIDYEHYKKCIGTTYGFLMDLIFHVYGRDFRTDPTLKKETDAIKTQMVAAEGFPEIPGTAAMIHQMQKAGYRLAVASSSPEQAIHDAMQYLQIHDCFEVLCSGQHVLHSKPAPDIFLLTASKLALSAEECLIIEDSTNGALAASAAGIRCIGFDNPDSGDQDLSTCITQISSWKEFTPALIRQLDTITVPSPMFS